MVGNSGVVFWGILLLVFVLAFSGVVFRIFFLIGEVEKKRGKNKQGKEDSRGRKMQTRQVKMWGQFHLCSALCSVCIPYSMKKAERATQR